MSERDKVLTTRITAGGLGTAAGVAAHRGLRKPKEKTAGALRRGVRRAGELLSGSRAKDLARRATDRGFLAEAGQESAGNLAGQAHAISNPETKKYVLSAAHGARARAEVDGILAKGLQAEQKTEARKVLKTRVGAGAGAAAVAATAASKKKEKTASKKERRTKVLPGAVVGGVGKATAGGAGIGAAAGYVSDHMHREKKAGVLNRVVSRLHGAGKKIEDKVKEHAVSKGKEVLHEIADNPETKKRLERVARDAGHHAVDEASKHPRIADAKKGLERGAKLLAGTTVGAGAVSTGTSIYQGNKTRKAIKEHRHG